MNLCNGFSLMDYARQRGYVLPAFNTTNLEMTIAIAKGLDAAGIPGYIQISSNNLRLSSPRVIAEIARFILKSCRTPIGLHLDHGKSFEHVQACVEAGFTSVMIDTSALPYEANVREVARVVQYCHRHDVPVEAELGTLPGKEDDLVSGDQKTDPAIVPAFVRDSGCDTLAVSVGNIHGLDAPPQIDLPLLRQIAAVCPVPLVLHGGSGIPGDVIAEAKQCGLIKINYGAAIRKEFISTFGRAYESDHNEHDVIHLSLAAVRNIAETVKSIALGINRPQRG